MFREQVQRQESVEPVVTSNGQSKLTRQPSSCHPLLRLQQTIGNRAVGRLLQAKLTISQPDDEYEREADRIAEQVMRMPDSAMRVQRQCACGEEVTESACENCQRKQLLLKRKATNSVELPAAPPIVHEVLRSPGQPLDPATRAFMEPRFGHDFSQVRLHANAKAAESAQAVNALAYTVGHDLVFGAGQYAPKTSKGRKLMAHELAHVVQQRASSSSLGQTILHRAPRSRPRGRSSEKRKASNIDLKSAQRLMGWILNIIDRVYRTEEADPSGWPGDALLSQYRDLLSLWYELRYGKKTNSSRVELEGELFLSYYERAKWETKPILELIERGGGTWQQILVDRWYPRFWEFEKRAESVKRIMKRLETQPSTLFWLYPTPESISLDEFFSDVAKQNSQVVPLQSGTGIKVGVAKAGTTYYASRNEPRLLLWASPQGVFFLLDNQIYAQSLISFSRDIIVGAIIKAAEDVAPFVELMTFVVDTAISFLPFGVIVDVTMAIKAATEGNWRDAALGLLPGPALGKFTKLAKATRVGRAAFRGGAKGASLLRKAFVGVATFVGKGIGKVKGKLTRGTWLVVEEAGGMKSYHFLGEATDVWHVVPEKEAVAFIRCSKCDLTWVGKGEIEKGAPSGVGPSAPTTAKSLPEAPSAVWQLYGTKRGQTIEHYMAKLYRRGGRIRRLPKNFKAIDFYGGGTRKVMRDSQGRWVGEEIEDALVISEKSVDLRGTSVKTTDGFFQSQSRHIDSLAEFESYKLKGIQVKNPSEKVLNLRYGPAPLSDEQVKGMEKLIKYAEEKGIQINISRFR